jgi:hypothetical protein
VSVDKLDAAAERLHRAIAEPIAQQFGCWPDIDMRLIRAALDEAVAEQDKEWEHNTAKAKIIVTALAEATCKALIAEAVAEERKRAERAEGALLATARVIRASDGRPCWCDNYAARAYCGHGHARKCELARAVLAAREAKP